VQLDDVSDDGQADAQAAVGPPAAAVELAKTIEHERLERGGDAAAGVLHLDDDFLVVGCHVQLDAATRGRELDRVRQQVPDRLLQARGVAGEAGRQRAHAAIERDSLGLGRGPHGVDGDVHDRLHVDGLDLDAQLARDDARDVQDVFDQLGLCAGVALDGLQRLLFLVG